MRLSLVCEEVIKPSRGREQRTGFGRAIYRKEIAVEQPWGDGRLRGHVNVPSRAMHSLELEHHQIVWFLAVRLDSWFVGELRYPLTVQPSEPGGHSSAGGPPARLDADHASLWLDGLHSTFVPGATLTGGSTVRPPSSGCLSVELSVLWYTQDKGPEEMGVCHYEAREANNGTLSLDGTRGFQVRLPAGPFSYDGEQIVIRWVVRLRLRCSDGTEHVSELPFHLRTALLEEAGPVEGPVSG
jgi:hypothetical protein